MTYLNSWDLCLSRFLVEGNGAASWSGGRHGSFRLILSDFCESVSLIVSDESPPQGSRPLRGVPTGVPIGVPKGVTGVISEIYRYIEKTRCMHLNL